MEQTKGVFISINGVIGGGAIAEFKTDREATQFVDALKRKAATIKHTASLLAALESLVRAIGYPVGCTHCTIEIDGDGEPQHQSDCPIFAAQAAIKAAKGNA